MATLLEILKAQGATEADLEQMKPFLTNAKFTGAIEAEIQAKAEAERKYAEANGKLTEFESQRNQFEVKATEAEKKVSDYDDWYNNKITPALAKIQQETVSKQAAAAAETARYKAALEAAQTQYGFEIPLETPANTPAAAAAAATGASVPAPGGNAPVPVQQPTIDTSKFASVDDLNSRTEMFGQALAATNDLLMEHVSLFGTNKPVNFEQLRTKAVAERKPLREIWERELHVPERKQEIAAKAQAEVETKRKAELDAARQEGIELGMSRSINPNTRAGESGPSNYSVISQARTRDAVSPPWVGNADLRQQGRIEKVISHLAKAGVA
jgi:hypothetical protein